MSFLASKEFSLAVFGFSPTERALITSICRLSQMRAAKPVAESPFSFKLVADDSAQEADIFLVDADDYVVLDMLAELLRNKPNTRCLSVLREPLATAQTGKYMLKRARIGGLLLKELDQLVQEPIDNSSVLAETKTETETEAKAMSIAKQCLIVDDSRLVRTHMEVILRKYGLALTFAEDAETALKLAKDRYFDIIFLDVILPEMNGYKACKLLKDDPLSHDSKVVMLTSKKSPFNKMHGALVGCDKYLTKPVNEDRVEKVLQDYNFIENYSTYIEPDLVPS